MADHTHLRRTITALRSDVPMRAEWRNQVLREIDRLPQPAAPPVRVMPEKQRRGWTIRPAVAIAAGIVCAVAGSLLTLGVGRALGDRSGSPRPGTSTATSQYGAPVRFVFVDPAASSVAIVGDFNGWSPTGTAMRRSSGGLWSVDLSLPAGRHTYAFVVDGIVVRDPNALDSTDDDYGVPSSVVLVNEVKRT